MRSWLLLLDWNEALNRTEVVPYHLATFSIKKTNGGDWLIWLGDTCILCEAVSNSRDELRKRWDEGQRLYLCAEHALRYGLRW